MTRVISHAEYVAFDERMRFRASGAPDSPWMRVEPGEGVWPNLAHLARKVRSSTEELHIEEFFYASRVQVPGLTAMPDPQSLVQRLLDGEGELSVDTCELLALLFVALPNSSHPLDAFLRRVPSSLDFRRRSWAVDIGENRGGLAQVREVLDAFAPALEPVDRLEIEIANLRHIESPADARVEAERLGVDVSALLEPQAACEPGSAQHRLAVLELRVLLECAYRHLEDDEAEEAVKVSQRAYALANSRGLPGADPSCPHDLAGFDLAAQIAAANWLHAATLADAAIGNQALFSGAPGTPVHAAQQALHRVLHGRYMTEYDGLTEGIDHTADRAWNGQGEGLLDTLDGFAVRSRFIRSRLHWSMSLRRLARLQLDIARDSKEPEKAEEAAYTALTCGDVELLRSAAERMLAAERPAAHLISEATGRQRPTRVARLTLIEVLAETLKDEDLATSVQLAIAELGGPFSMDSRLDVQRTAVKTTARLLAELSGLGNATRRSQLQQEILGAWSLLADSKQANWLTWHAIAEGAVQVLAATYGSDNWSSGRAPLMLLRIAKRVTERMQSADGSPWVNLVRPAVEYALGDAARDRVAQVRRDALSLIPVVELPTGGEVPSQNALLAMLYRAELGEPPRSEQVHELVERMSRYLRPFIEDPSTPGWRWPLRADLIMPLAEHGYSADAAIFRKLLVEMVLSKSALLEARCEAAQALIHWIGTPDSAKRARRLADVYTEHPGLATSILEVIECGEPARDRAPRQFGPASSLLADLLPLAYELIGGQDRRFEGPLLVRLLAVVERVAHNLDEGASRVARNIAASLLVEPAVPEEKRTGLVLLFIASQHLDDALVRAANRGLRYGLSRQPITTVSCELRRLIVEHIVDRIRRGSPVTRREARLTLRALREQEPLSGGDTVTFDEADERAWRRSQPRGSR